MSDIAFYGVGSFLVALVFLALDGLLVLSLAALVVVRLVRKQVVWTPVVPGMIVSIVALALGAGMVMYGAEQWPRETDDAIAYWGPAIVLLTIASGAGTAFVVHSQS